jgi:hypothetical protein
MYISLSSLFKYKRKGCPCRVNGGFTGSSAMWWCLRMRDKHGGNTATASTVHHMVGKILECYKDPASFSMPVQWSLRPFTSGYCKMAHVPGKWSDYASQAEGCMTGTGRKTLSKPWFRVHRSHCAACQLRKMFHTLQRIVRLYLNMFPYHIFVTSQTDHSVYLLYRWWWWRQVLVTGYTDCITVCKLLYNELLTEQIHSFIDTLETTNSG